MSRRRRDLDELIRQEREQFKANLNDEQKQISRGFDRVEQARKERKVHSTTNHYMKYAEKLSKREFDKFSSRDLLFYFKDKAKANGIRFVSTVQNDIRYMNNLKQARKNYEVTELMVMMEFLFDSEQDYLDKHTLHPGIFVTQWVNTIYRDTELWVEDKYVPRSRSFDTRKLKLEEFKKNREWGDTKAEVDTSLTKRRIEKRVKQLQEEHKKNNGWG